MFTLTITALMLIALGQVNEFDRIQSGARLAGSDAFEYRSVNDKVIVAEMERQLDAKAATRQAQDLRAKLARLPARTRAEAEKRLAREWPSRERWLRLNGASAKLIEADKVKTHARIIAEIQRERR
jgi:hypothetical protein